MTEPAGTDVTVPSPARVYDHVLGGHLALSEASGLSEAEAIARLGASIAGTPAESVFRDAAGIAARFTGFELVGPGLVPRPGTGGPMATASRRSR